ncbi:MAG: hypothetical protein AABY75_00325, partial [Bacteroidota bacterium]
MSEIDEQRQKVEDLKRKILEQKKKATAGSAGAAVPFPPAQDDQKVAEELNRRANEEAQRRAEE